MREGSFLAESGHTKCSLSLAEGSRVNAEHVTDENTCASVTDHIQSGGGLKTLGFYPEDTWRSFSWKGVWHK